jgi:two-component system, OmpR family, sensor kinase
VTLRARLMLAFAFLLLMAVAALSVPLAISVERRARAEFSIELNAAAEAVAVAAPPLLERPRALAELAQSHSPVGRIIVTDADARLLADTTMRRRLGRDYRYRPEIGEALEGHTTRLVRDYPNSGRQYLVAVPIIDAGRVVGAVRVQRLVENVDALVRERLLALGGVSLAVLVVGLLASAALARWLTRPLHRLAGVAASIGEGDLTVTAAESGQLEVAEVGEALNLMRDRIHDMLAAQTDFVANASHQLRTPLTGLRLRLEALAASGDDRALPMLAETDRLGSLIDDLLTLVRAGTTPREPAVVDLQGVVEDAVVRWSPQADEAGHLLYVGDTTAPAIALAEPNDVTMILDNLIENALKYTPPGTSVEVSLRDAGRNLELVVSDDGPGVAPGDQGRVFERFFRGMSPQGVPGTGLGLAIVRQIARRWEGGVELHSDGGTTVRVTLRRGAVASATSREVTARL